MKNTERAPGHWRESITNQSNDVTSFSATALDHLVVCDPFTSHKVTENTAVYKSPGQTPLTQKILHLCIQT